MTDVHLTSIARGCLPALQVTGDIDLDSAETVRAALEERLRAAPDARVLADLSGVTFLDCAGLAALLAVSRSASDRGGWLRLLSPSRQVVRLVQLTAVEEQLATHADREAAPCGGTTAYAELPSPRAPGSLHRR